MNIVGFTRVEIFSRSGSLKLLETKEGVESILLDYQRLCRTKW